MRRLLFVAAILSPLLLTGATPKTEYRLLARYQLGGEGGWDYLTIDSTARRLYITRGTHVMVVDPDSGKLLGDIPYTPGVHGVALDLQEGRGFTSNGRENTVTIFDLKTPKEIARPKVGDGPDAIAYDPVSHRVFTFNGRGHDTTAIEAGSGAVAGSIPLGGKPEFSVSDGQGKMYVNIEDKSEIVEFDPQKLAVLHRWPLTPCESPTGLAIDRKHRRLFVGCGNKLMAVMNADNGKIVATLPIGAGVDATAFDDASQLAFSSNGSGTLTVIHEDSPDKYAVVQTLDTARGARTMTLDPKTHNVYTVTAQFGPPPAPTPEQPRPRPAMVPGSFELLVFGTK